MSAVAEKSISPQLALRACIQKVATGPEYSKDLSQEETREAMRLVLDGTADPVQTAVFLIALRMKRETDDENKGILQAIRDTMPTIVAPVDELVDVADPYDGYARGLPASPFLAPVLAACGVPAVSHGLQAVGPKFGITHRMVLQAAGADVDLASDAAVQRIADPNIGWAYIDQKAFCPPLHDLVPLRTRIVKRQVLTTVEVLTGPVRARKATHLMTGYVHKAYPPIYAELARFAGFDSALIIRGVEGGIIPSLQQDAKLWFYHDKGEEQFVVSNPATIGIDQPTRAVPLPEDLPPAGVRDDQIATAIDSGAAARHAAEAGIAALEGKAGPVRDSLIYGAAICLWHLKRYPSLADAADAVREVIDSGEPLAHFRA
ncbi:MAG: anthranilate phosphoribosyltransferase [Pseudomonadota bacterium]|nr:MAG: anthranilate phosphoribosyltransferase [Pseudomonadota bacterium]